MSADESMDRRAVDGAAAPWREPELGVQLTDEAREYEAMLCSRETQRIYGGRRHGRSPAQGLATREALLAAPPDCRLVATRRGVFFEIRVLDHPGRIGQETIVHFRWLAGWAATRDARVVSCEFYAPLQASMPAVTIAPASHQTPGPVQPLETFETEPRLLSAIIDYPAQRDTSAAAGFLGEVRGLVEREHGLTVKTAVANSIPRWLLPGLHSL